MVDKNRRDPGDGDTDLSSIRRYIAGTAALAALILAPAGAVGETPADSDQQQVFEQVQRLFSTDPTGRLKALAWIRDRGKPDVVAPLIYGLRYLRAESPGIAATLEVLTGVQNGDDWFQWMLWQQAHPEVTPFAGFDTFQSSLFARIDMNFIRFLYPDVKHEIRLEEIAWGGVVKDGIPALTNPDFVEASQADYLNDDEPVFGVTINGDARAYPYRIMDWHEMFNDVIGGVPVSLAYCTLCGSGILYDTRVDGYDRPFVFGSSGFLYRSNKLMYDRETHSLWNQFTGRPVVGELTGSGIELKILPVVTTSWLEWRRRYPDARVLSLETGYQRDYTPGRPYGEYFADAALMFPALTTDQRLRPKDEVFGLRITGAEKAWPLAVFDGGRVINDRVGIIDMVLVGDAGTRTVRAYRSGGRKFEKSDDELTRIRADQETWQVTEGALRGPGGATLPRLPGHLAYWFAWSGYLGNAELYEAAD